MKLLLLFGVLFAAQAALGEEVVCKYDYRMVESPADPRLAGHNRNHPGIKIRCIGGQPIHIANERLAKKFDDEFNGRAKGAEARMNGTIRAEVKKRSGNLLEVTSYKFVEDVSNAKK